MKKSFFGTNVWKGQVRENGRNGFPGKGECLNVEGGIKNLCQYKEMNLVNREAEASNLVRQQKGKDGDAASLPSQSEEGLSFPSTEMTDESVTSSCRK